MTKEKQRIAIAEFCGFRNVRKEDGTMLEGAFLGMLIGEFGLKNYPVAIPRYTEDLNAMHEAEECLKNASWILYNQMGELLAIKILKGEEGIFHATAAQRAEAFIKTIGRWEETCS